MFVYSFKASKKQIVSMILCAVMLIAVLVVAIFCSTGNASAQTYQPVKGDNENNRIAFLTGLGYEIDTSAPTVREILIPDEFDEVFENYNKVQQQADMDLKPYRGKRVKCWSYRVLNIPEQGEVLANLFVYKGKIIGGDISSTALDGFMHGLVKYNYNKAAMTTTGTMATTTSSTKSAG
ncbi:MAG: DUF4830 domain-containing protein [Oscillospiraceae bacterium]|jgi:hypothetical protein|nr:DUF4830 domain-containing protein [Oscillospiraceae bacterium]